MQDIIIMTFPLGRQLAKLVIQFSVYIKKGCHDNEKRLILCKSYFKNKCAA